MIYPIGERARGAYSGAQSLLRLRSPEKDSGSGDQSVVETLHEFSYMFPPNMGVVVFCTSPDSMYPGNLADAMVERGRLSARSADSSIGSGEGFVKEVTGRLERIVVEAAHQGAGRGAEERSPPKKGPRVSRGHPGESAGARATAAGLTVPEIVGGDCESDEEMRRSELDEGEHDDGGISDDEDERDRGTDDDMDDERTPGPSRRREDGDGGRRRPQGGTHGSDE